MTALTSADFEIPDDLTALERKNWRNRKPRPIYDKKTRTCLCCRKDFTSKWVGNRVCYECKRQEPWEGSGFEEYGVKA